MSASEASAVGDWTRCRATACGLELFTRPCHEVDVKVWPERSFPLEDVCRSTKEAVFIVEDCDEQRHSLVEAVEFGGYVAVACSNAADLQEKILPYRTGCILLDVRLPDLDGVGLQAWLRAKAIPLPVIFMSGQADVATAVQCMKRGATDFLRKPFSGIELHDAITAAVARSRQSYCSSESLSYAQSLVAKLTPMERKVAGMISAGFPTKAIASTMGRSENTIKIHRHRVFSKLSVLSAASVAQIMRHARGPD